MTAASLILRKSGLSKRDNPLIMRLAFAAFAHDYAPAFV